MLKKRKTRDKIAGENILRSSQNRKVGLVLSSGAARGLAHIGVLEILENEGIHVDMIAGTSMGAIIGALYAQGKTAAEIREVAMDLGWMEMAKMLAFTTPKTGLLSGQRIKARIKKIIGDVGFSDLRIPFACVATDILTGEEVVIKQGPVLEAVIASMSIPIIFRVARWEGRYLVDGGSVNPVPVSVVKDMGADLIIASDVIVEPVTRARNTQSETQAWKDTGKIKEPNIFNIMMQFVNITAYQSVKYGIVGADVVIKPNMADIGFTEFGNASECILQGKAAAQPSVPEIKRLLAG